MDSQTLETLLAQPDLNDRSKVVLVVLSHRGPASAAQIAQAAGHHLRKVQLTLRDLVQQGLVEVYYHGRQARYRLSAECGQLTAECGKSAKNSVVCEQSFADYLKFRERSFANPPSSNARTRTSQSSSSEEDPKEYPVPSPTEGGTGGNNPVIHMPYLAQMKEAWRPIAPGVVSDPEDWFHKLYREFGLEIPLAVFRQFALSERTLQDLKHPENYKSYFTRCCYTERERHQASISDNGDAGKEEGQTSDLLTVYLSQRRNRPCKAS